MMKIRPYLIVFLCFILFTVSTCKKDSSEEDESPAINRTATPNDFLSEKKYNQLIVEIQYVKGYKPTDTTVVNLKKYLQQYLHKSAGIIIVQNEIPSPGKAVYSLEDIRKIEKEHRTEYSGDQTLSAYYFFADGDYAGNSDQSKTLGFQFGNTSMAIFEKTIQLYQGGILAPPISTLETTVALHEFCHVLGLVNNGTGMVVNHQDSAYGAHCKDEKCLMYYSAETNDIISYINGNNVPYLTTACVNDLRANGAK